MRRISFGHLCSGLALSLVLAGCNSGRPKTAPVSGAVTLDGKPIAGAFVIFVPVAGGRPAQGETDIAGRFQLGTFDERTLDGATLGEHQVTITKFIPNKDVVQQRPFDPPDANDRRPKVILVMPKKYSDTTTSGLTATVTEGTNDVRFDLKSNP